MSSSNVMVSIAEFLIGHSSHGAVLLRYLRDLNFGKNEFLRKHKVHVCLLRFIFCNRVTLSYCSVTIQLKPLLGVKVFFHMLCFVFLVEKCFFLFHKLYNCPLALATSSFLFSLSQEKNWVWKKLLGEGREVNMCCKCNIFCAHYFT